MKRVTKHTYETKSKRRFRASRKQGSNVNGANQYWAVQFRSAQQMTRGAVATLRRSTKLSRRAANSASVVNGECSALQAPPFQSVSFSYSVTFEHNAWSATYSLGLCHFHTKVVNQVLLLASFSHCKWRHTIFNSVLTKKVSFGKEKVLLYKLVPETFVRTENGWGNVMKKFIPGRGWKNVYFSLIFKKFLFMEKV